MRGKTPINWLWDWLGAGSMGENYNVVEIVQPVVPIDAFQWPMEFQTFTAANVAYAIGTTTFSLPDPEPKELRLWLSLWVTRSVIAGADIVQLRRGVLNNQTLLYQTKDADVNEFRPVIGGVQHFGATKSDVRGTLPQPATLQAPLSLAFIALGAGLANLTGSFVDVPLSSPLTGVYPR
jgi:hypothetical protein